MEKNRLKVQIKSSTIIKIFRIAVLILFLNEKIFCTEDGTISNIYKKTERIQKKEISVSKALPPKSSCAIKKKRTLGSINNPEVNIYIQKLTTPAGIRWINDSLKRGSIYFHFIKSKIKEYGLPDELLYLPLVESAYDINAISKSGAIGLWQFMENSIEPYDIKITPYADERRDFMKSTEGALKKLKANHSALGDWLLAIAAYNSGLGSIQRSVSANGTSDFWLLCQKNAIREETRNYIPKFLAITEICTNKRKYKIAVDWNHGQEWQLIKIDHPIDITLLSEISNVPLSDIKKGNAELSTNITPLDIKNYYLKIMVQYADIIENTLKERGTDCLKTILHQIKTGDTLYSISEQYKMPVSLIEKFNKKINLKNLKTGQEIAIPFFDLPPERQKPIETTQALDPRPYSSAYEVKKGDTLWAIAKKFNTTPENIARQNQISINDVLKHGSILKVPATEQDIKESQ